MGTRRVTLELRRHLPASITRDSALNVLRTDDDILELASAGRIHFQTKTGVTDHPASDVVVPNGRDLRPVRKIGSHKDAPNRIGLYAYVRDGYALYLAGESLLEIGHFRKLDFDPTTQWMHSQPFAMTWHLPNRLASRIPITPHTRAPRAMWRIPDLLVRDNDGWVVYDIKPGPPEERPPYMTLMFRLTELTLREAGWRYRIGGTLSRLHLRNLRTIAHYRWPNPRLAPAVDSARLARASSLGGVAASSGGGAPGRAVALHLLAHELSTDLDRPLGYGSPVTWLNTKGG